ncbi:hypothetical protein F5H01DRAFT_368592 [Linnemannia elongata]|nr:hypothetical protein F5H01DRAFT_368592 [Linnemannia elongata]
MPGYASASMFRQLRDEGAMAPMGLGETEITLRCIASVPEVILDIVVEDTLSDEDSFITLPVFWDPESGLKEPTKVTSLSSFEVTFICKVIPFLKGNDFHDLDPLRLACIPEITLEVVLDDVHTNPGTHSSISQQKPLKLSAELPQEVPQGVAVTIPATFRGRNPHGHMELALTNLHMAAPPNRPL